MKTNAPGWRTARSLHVRLPAVVFLMAVLLGRFALAADDADKEAKAGAGAAAKTEAPKPAVRIVALKGTYVDYPATADVDPMSLLLGGLEKPSSFFALCEKLGELAKDDEVQHVLFDLSSPTLHLDLGAHTPPPRLHTHATSSSREMRIL